MELTLDGNFKKMFSDDNFYLKGKNKLALLF